MTVSPAPVEVFCCYSHADEQWLRRLETHLSLLQRQGLISLWYDRRIAPGIDWTQAIDAHLETASVILLLVSADFLTSEYCYSVEMKRALERHEAGQARVVPILVRSVNWDGAPFAHLQALPTNAKPITSWRDKATALADVAAGIRRVIEDVPFLAKSASRTALPPIWNIPYPRNPFFLGRDTELAQVRNHLQAGQAAALSQPQAISGLGGIGKTQLAVEYAYRFHHEYQVVLWARAENQEALLASAITLAKHLHLPEHDAQKQEVIIQAVKTWLQSHRGWLLILDNADDLDLLSTFLPSTSTGHILITTRAWDMQQIAQRIEVEELPLEQGALLLLRRAGLLALDGSLEDALADERTYALQLAKQMGGLPLCLDQAGAYLEATGISLEDFQRLYQQHRRTLHAQRRARTLDHPESVNTTLLISFQRIEQLDPAAADLLRLCAFLAPDVIPEELLIQGALLFGPVLSPVLTDPFRLAQAIETLRSASLLHRNPRTRMLSVHRLVQSVVEDALPIEAQRQWKHRVILGVSEVFPEVEFATWPACERLLPHALQCVTWIEHEQFETTEAVLLLHDTGYYLQERGRYQEAEPLFQSALRICEQVLGLEHPWAGRIQHEMAVLYQRQHKYAQAEPLFQSALRICEQTLGREHLWTASTLHAFASLYQNLGNYAEAELLYQRSLRIKEQEVGPEDPFTASTLQALASLYQNQGMYAEAEPLYQRTLWIKENALGADHPSTGITLQMLASLYQNQGMYAEAEPLYQRSLLIFERAFGPDNLWTASVLQALATLYQNQGMYAEAEPLYQRALRIREQSVGSEPPPMRTQKNPPAYLRRLKYEPKVSGFEANTSPDQNT